MKRPIADLRHAGPMHDDWTELDEDYLGIFGFHPDLPKPVAMLEVGRLAHSAADRDASRDFTMASRTCPTRVPSLVFRLLPFPRISRPWMHSKSDRSRTRHRPVAWPRGIAHCTDCPA